MHSPLRDTSSLAFILTLGILGYQLKNLNPLSLVSWFLILPISWLIYRCWIYSSYISPLREIPTVPCNPLWGHYFAIIKEEAGVPFRLWHQRYGNIIRFFLPFGIEVISVADEKALKQMTVQDPYNFPYPLRVYISLRSVLGKGLLLAQGENHAHQRKILGPAFSNASVKSLSPIFWDKALLITKIWRQQFVSQAVRYRSIDTLDWSTRAAVDIIGEAAFGVKIDSLRNPEAPINRAYRIVASTEHNLIQGLRFFFTYLKYIPIRVSSEVQKSREIIKREAGVIVDGKLKHKSTAADEKDIMSLIIKTNESIALPESQMTLATLKDQVRTFIGSGHDTTSVALAWTLLLLAQNPDVQVKLREEIREHMPFLSTPGSEDVASQEDFPDADRLPYLNSVTRECLRFIPPIPLTMRQTCSATHLGSYPIRPGTLVLIPINAINRLPCYWGDDADTFDPERWKNLPPEWATSSYLTFMQGPKGCIARKFAETEFKILLCCLIGRFNFGIDEMAVNPARWKMWRVVLRPMWGVNLKVSLIEL